MENTTAEITRRLENIVRLGTVAEVRYSRVPAVRVRVGQILTGWLPITTQRAGTTKTWNPPTPGEQVVLLAPSGELTAAVVLPGVASNHNPAPDDDKDNARIQYPDGATIDYNSKEHHYTVTVPESGKIIFKIGATTLELSDSGTVLTTPRFDGVQA